MNTTPNGILVGISLDDVDGAFHGGEAKNVTVLQIPKGSWMFAFEVAQAKGKKFTLRSQRGKLRTWSDPRRLFSWLKERYGIVGGSFVLLSEDENAYTSFEGVDS